MLRLKDHFKIEGNVGGKPWYALALAVASKFDEGAEGSGPMNGTEGEDGTTVEGGAPGNS